ncbi:hypothetical protein D9M71_203650 [compost metagenome]
MRPVVGDHGVEVTADGCVAALFLRAEGDIQVGHETAFLKALAVVFSGADIGLQVDVGVGSGAHHAGRSHFDRLQVHRADLQPRAQLRLADGVFLGQCRRGDQEQGE